MNPKRPDAAKDNSPKPYVKPELKEFGDVAELTRAVDGIGANDGGMSLMTKT